VDFKCHANLKANLSDFDDNHPLLITFELNPMYMDIIESLFDEIKAVANFATKIQELKDISNWQSVISELEFVRKIMALTPEFIKKEKSARTADIRATLSGNEAFFEVKLLLENDESHRLYGEIWKLESDLLVRISHDTLDKTQVDNLIRFLKDKVTSKSTGSFSFDGTDIAIQKRETPQSKRTALITVQRASHITFEPIRRKIFMDFYSKLTQFESCKPVFWVIDCQRWKYDRDDIARAVYGTIQRDMTVGNAMHGFSNIMKRASENLGLFNGTNLIPALTYPLRDGLFFLHEASCLNGVIAKNYGETGLLVNPFAKHQLGTNKIGLLKTTLEH
jgi:hypothetical protein